MVGRSNKALFIEGATDDKNGDLGRGFSTLLKQKLSGRMPRIYMGNGASQTVDKYKNAPNVTIKTLLIDLDGKGTGISEGNYTKAIDNKKRLHDFSRTDIVYFMVQTMEAWFLSQPNILEEYFKMKFNNIPFNHPSKIEEPDKVLNTLTRELRFNSYHKVRDGSRLLGKLDLSKLETAFTDVRELVEKLS